MVEFEESLTTNVADALVLLIPIKYQEATWKRLLLDKDNVAELQRLVDEVLLLGHRFTPDQLQEIVSAVRFGLQQVPLRGARSVSEEWDPINIIKRA